MEAINRMQTAYQPLFMSLKAVMVESFDSNSESRTRFHRSSSILLYPTLENTAKASLSQEALWSKVSCGSLKVIEIKFSELRCKFQFFSHLGSRYIAFRITSSSRTRDNGNNRLVPAIIICCFTFCWSKEKTLFKWIV